MSEKLVMFLLILCQPLLTVANNRVQNEIKTQKYQNMKTYSGPMGMGLIKSFQLGNEKKCVYNTIDGQITISLDEAFKICPKNIKK